MGHPPLHADLVFARSGSFVAHRIQGPELALLGEGPVDWLTLGEAEIVGRLVQVDRGDLVPQVDIISPEKVPGIDWNDLEHDLVTEGGGVKVQAQEYQDHRRRDRDEQDELL